MKLFSPLSSKQVILLVYLLIINLISFLAFALDKSGSRRDKWRTKESTLFILSLLGGASGGMIGMLIFHHKISQKKFYIGLPLIFILNKLVSLLIFIRL